MMCLNIHHLKTENRTPLTMVTNSYETCENSKVQILNSNCLNRKRKLRTLENMRLFSHLLLYFSNLNYSDVDEILSVGSFHIQVMGVIEQILMKMR